MAFARDLSQALSLAALAALAAGCTVEHEPEVYAWRLPPSLPVPAVPADNPMTAAKVELGRHLFYDPRLSGNGTQACASCHVQARAFSDGRSTSPGSTGDAGVRNAQGLANVAYRSSLTWADPTMRRLEDQARVPMHGSAPIELGLPADDAAIRDRLAADPVYAALFADAFPDEPTPFTLAAVTRALASFERTIVSGGSRFDRDGLSEAERRGFALFSSPLLGCARCHDGFDFTAGTGNEPRFFATVHPSSDLGLAAVSGDPAHAGRFRPPSLRNVAITAPYFHDGSVSTLEEVVAIYATARAFVLTETQRAELVAFLGALTDDELRTDARLANPWPLIGAGE